jgi:hypothetical protein
MVVLVSERGAVVPRTLGISVSCLPDAGPGKLPKIRLYGHFAGSLPDCPSSAHDLERGALKGPTCRQRADQIHIPLEGDWLV